jgi:hypothetical protein
MLLITAGVIFSALKISKAIYTFSIGSGSGKTAAAIESQTRTKIKKLINAYYTYENEIRC